MELMEPTEPEEVRLSFLATRGEEEPPALDGMVTSGGAAVEEAEEVVEAKLLVAVREMDTTPSP